MHANSVAVWVGLVAGAMSVPVWADVREGVSGAGLQVERNPADWPRLQGRVMGGLATTPAAPGVRAPEGSLGLNSGAAVLGDFYFSRSFLGPHVLGGFRASSGLLLGASTSAGLRPASAPFLAGGPLGASSSVDASGHAPSAGNAPYLGVGYSGLSPRGGWGFTADLGVAAVSPGSGVKLGRSSTSNPTLEDTLREIRLSPVLRLGVSYEF